MRVKPNFLIVGAQKAGTTSLIHILDQHPDIHMPKHQIHFFDVDKNYDRGVAWYEDQIGEDIKTAPMKAGESSPRYSFQANVPERIYKNYPDMKLIWILRNPVDRTYSNYFHAIEKGIEVLPFEDALKAESLRIKKNIFYGYMERSKYHLQIGNYLNFFDQKQMFYLKYEDLYDAEKSRQQLNALFEFLEVEPYAIESLPRTNQTIVPRFPLRYSKWKLKFRQNALGLKLLHMISFAGKKKGYPEMDANTRSVLLQYFDKENESLSSLTKLDLSSWKN